MNNKWIAIVSIITISCVGTVNIWMESDSECEVLTKEGKNKQAFPVCLVAAQQGNAYAQNSVAISYMTGEGVPKDTSKGLQWLHRSAQQGFSKAQSNIGLEFLVDRKNDKDLAQAVKWWQLAATNGEPHAQYNLAVSYQHGRGIEENNSLATKWFLMSAFDYLKQGMLKDSFKSLTEIIVDPYVKTLIY